MHHLWVVKKFAVRVLKFISHLFLWLILKHSARIIRSSVFGIDDNKKVRDKFVFPQNNLVITSIDVQSVEPVDQRTRDSLQKSVQLAIEITTNSQEATARWQSSSLCSFCIGLDVNVEGLQRWFFYCIEAVWQTVVWFWASEEMDCDKSNVVCFVFTVDDL